MRGIRALCLLALIAPTPAFATVINVSAFGAVPNDGVSDASAINNAISSAGAGDTVLFAPGTYDVSAKIVTKSNMNLLGAGTSSVLRFTGTSNIPMLGIENVSNVSISQLTLDANNSSKATGGIYATSASNLNLHDLTVKNFAIKTGFAPHAIFFDGAVTNSVIQNTTLTNIGTASQWGAGIRLGHGSSFNQVLNNTIANTGRGGILCDDLSTDLLIRNNTVTGSGGTGLGIELFDGCDRAIVEDNHIDHWLSVDSSNNLAIRRNVISDKSGVYKYTGLELVDAHDNIYTDNVIDGGQQLGISISGPQPKQHVLWARNTIKTPSTWGIQIQGESGGASEQYFYKNIFQGALRSSPNTLYAPQGNGVRINGDAWKIVFDGNEIRANQGSGIQVTGSNVHDLTFANNLIQDNPISAVDSAITMPNIVWRGNTVQGNGVNNELGSIRPFDLSGELRTSGATTAAPLNLLIDQPIQFSLFSGDKTSAFTHWLWDFGAGIPSTAAEPSFAYPALGTYHLMVVGWDAQGRAAMAQADVNVLTSLPANVPEPAAAVIAVAMTGLMWCSRRRRAAIVRVARGRR